MAAQIHSMLIGTLVSIRVFFLTILFSVPLALVFCAARMSKNFLLRNLTKWFLLLIRGTPLMLQLICVHFIPGILTHGRFSFERFVAAIIALVINYACYFAEIYRGGLESIPRGQYEAAKVLGYNKNQTFFYIVLPQVVKRIIPAMGNEVMTLVKDTALVQVIGLVELLHIAKTAANRMVSTVPLFVAGVFYFCMNGVVACFFNWLERKLSYYR